MNLRTRFAPSPTGYLHIGGVRTALFNWLLSRQSGGRYLLRIDDTDQMRNVAEALQPILEGFRWLGLDWDEGPDVGGPHEPYFQSQRGDRHREAAARLLASGHAYRDYAKPEELQELRQAAEKQGERFFYDRRFMAADDDAAKAYEAEGRVATIRLKMPRQGECVIDDLVRGEVRVPWSNEQDHVIQRTDGSCIYHLASTVDDHDFGITHVVRAEEHLSNTPRQIFILESLGFNVPHFAHVPYVAEPGGTAKLSKRKLNKYLKNKDFAALLQRGQAIAKRRGLQVEADTFNPVLVDFYREIGFEASALLNYLVLLGWSLDGETEKLSVDEMIKHFTLDRVNKSPAAFDPQKLLAFQATAFADLSVDQRLDRIRPFAEAAGWNDEATLRKVVTAAEDRIAIAGDIYQFEYCFSDDFPVDGAARSKHLEKDADMPARILRLADHFESQPWSTADEASEAVKAFCEAEGIKMKQIIHGLRVAVTGQAGGFSMFETLEIVGYQSSLERLRGTVASPS